MSDKVTSWENVPNFFVNLKIAQLSLDYEDIQLSPCKNGQEVHWGDGANWHTVDYCSVPNDIVPLSISEGISVFSFDHGKSWRARSITSSVSTSDKSFCKALALAYLEVKGIYPKDCYGHKESKSTT